MPSTPLRLRPSQQRLNENQADKHFTPSDSKYVPQIYAFHRRDLPLSGSSDLQSFDHWPNVGNSKLSPGFRMNAINSLLPDGGPSAGEMAKNQK